MIIPLTGSCLIKVEVAGSIGILSYSIAPEKVRGMAGWVIDQCVRQGNGMGGFVTESLARVADSMAQIERQNLINPEGDADGSGESFGYRFIHLLACLDFTLYLSSSVATCLTDLFLD